ncbi:MAG: hypothetical protein ACREDS_13425, partial [Limisphaerales bacterium]
TNGTFIASHVDHSVQLAFHAEKSGYYPSWRQYEMGFHYNPAKWNPVIDVVLEKVSNPTPMYARRAQIEVPVLDKPVGFDLVEYDWVAPYGKGKQGDIVFEAHRRWAGRRDFDVILRATFSNSGDGLIAVPTSSSPGSTGPRMPVTAPLDGYTPEVQCELGNTPAGG